MACRRGRGANRAVALLIVVVGQLLGLLVALFADAAMFGMCMETNACSVGSTVDGVVGFGVALAILMGSCVVAFRVADVPRWIVSGMATWSGAWAGGVAVTYAVGLKPLVGVVFGFGVVAVMVSERRRETAAVAGAAALITAVLEIGTPGQGNGGVAAVLLVAVAAVAVLLPRAPSPA